VAADRDDGCRCSGADRLSDRTSKPIHRHDACRQGQPRYRKQAAQHLYERNSGRIYQGMLPPMLYAIGVLQFNSTARAA
jgi:hypothetical protein